jgi:hypothetical protein
MARPVLTDAAEIDAGLPTTVEVAAERVRSLIATVARA